MEREKSRTICHIRGQTCSLTTRSLTQFYYIYKIINTCLPYYSKGNHENLGNSSSQQSFDVAPATKNFLRYKEKHLSLCVNKSVFYFLLELKTACQVIPTVSCLSDSIDHEEDPRCHQNSRKG